MKATQKAIWFRKPPNRKHGFRKRARAGLLLFGLGIMACAAVRAADEETPAATTEAADTKPESKPEAKPETTEPSAKPAEKPDDKVPKAPAPPPDKKLTALHAEFKQKAEKLANDYLKAKQPDRAVVVYEEILKIVPDDPKITQQLDKLRGFEAKAGRRVFEVQANRDWQDTGVRVMAGKPLKLSVTGTWTLNMSEQLGPEGMELPKAVKDFKLGSLVGWIVDPMSKTPKPFTIGAGKEFVAEQSGPLLVRMHDLDPTDNRGSLTLEIQGRFESK